VIYGTLKFVLKKKINYFLTNQLYYLIVYMLPSSPQLTPKRPKSLQEQLEVWVGFYNVNFHCNFLKLLFGDVEMY
jgi:hypothetical protein